MQMRMENAQAYANKSTNTTQLRKKNVYLFVKQDTKKIIKIIYVKDLCNVQKILMQDKHHMKIKLMGYLFIKINGL